jgi:hypothetical protein
MTLLLCLSAGVWSALCVLAGYFVRGSEGVATKKFELKEEYKLRRVK